ncbi:MAG: hypothetical protein NTV52_00880 [Acidobacteria bacterium]|nr:hypothetical protein [Acidobacteriota bacterium]
MEATMHLDPAFWKELANEFRSLLDRVGDLTAEDVGDNTYVIQGGLGDANRQARTHREFKTLAIEASNALGCPVESDSLYWWLWWLADGKEPRLIDRIVERSAHRCRELKTLEWTRQNRPEKLPWASDSPSSGRFSLTATEEESSEEQSQDLRPFLNKSPVAKPTKNREAVDKFLERCKKIEGFKPLRKHIWLSVGHERARQFQYWQAEHERATYTDNENFDRTVTMEPAKFLEQLKMLNLVTLSSAVRNESKHSSQSGLKSAGR